MDEKTFCFEGYTLDLRRGSVCAGDRELALRPKSFNVLRYLVENAGRLVSKDELAEAAWPHVSAGDESVTRCVSDVRRALDDGEQRIIKTVLKQGYIFIAPISHPDSDPGPPATRMAGEPDEALSLVVMPFADLTGDPAQDCPADAVTEGLMTYLSRLPDIVVFAWSSALVDKRGPADARRIGRELGVRYVLQGSQQRGGTRLRVSARIVNAQSGAHLWVDQFDADYTDPLDMQDGIITRLARTIHIELTALEAARISRLRPMSADAEDLARRGEAVWLRYGPNREEVEAGYELCERALALDPHNVRALSILAEKFATRVTASQSDDREGDIRRASELAGRALACNPNSHHAQHAKARLLLAKRQPEQSLVTAELGLAMNPSFIPAYQVLSMGHLFVARADQVIGYADKAMRLNPLDPYVYMFYALKAYGHVMLGAHDRAIGFLRQAVANNPDFPTPVAWLAAMLALVGQDAEARETLKYYFSLPRSRTRTVTQWRSLQWADNPGYVAYRERLYEGLRKAGMPEE